MKYSILLLALLTGCFRYDMEAAGWAHATELCQSHGGLTAADMSRDGTSMSVYAKCADNSTVRKYFQRTTP